MLELALPAQSLLEADRLKFGDILRQPLLDWTCIYIGPGNPEVGHWLMTLHATDPMVLHEGNGMYQPGHPFRWKTPSMARMKKYWEVIE